MSECSWLLREASAAYAACERRGGATLAEAGKRDVLLRGPAMFEELLPIDGRHVLRVVFEKEEQGPYVRAAAVVACDAMRAILAERTPSGPLVPPAQGGGGGGGEAPAEIGVYDGARKRLN
jgi:hypothetical protein